MRSTYLVAMRDYLGYVTAWGFWLGLLFTPVLLGIFMVAPGLAKNVQPTRYFTVLEQGEEFTKALRAEFQTVEMTAAREAVDPINAMQGKQSEKLDVFDQAVEAGSSPRDALEAAGGTPALFPAPAYVEIASPVSSIDDLLPYLLGERLVDTPTGPQPLFAAIIVPDADEAIQYWSENLQAQDLLRLAATADRNLAQQKVYAAANISPTIVQEAWQARREVVQQRIGVGETDTGGALTIVDKAPYVASIGMAFMLWFLIFSVINYLLMGTIEERSNKIFDSLLTSVKLPNLLAGKLLAVLALALTLMTFWALGSALVGVFASKNWGPEVTANIFVVLNAVMKPSLVIPAVISFVLGYLMYGSLFLALGSLCDTIQEAQTLMTPLIVLLMAPLLMLVFAINDAQSPIISTMVWVPLFTPFLLILRMPTEPPLWEVLAQLGLMAVAALTILYLATRVYRAGAVHGAGVADVWAFFGKLVPGKKKAADQG